MRSENSPNRMSDRDYQLCNLWPGLLACGFLIIGSTVVDLVGAVWPFRPESIEWRYSAIGMASSYTVTPTIGIGLLLLAAILSDQTTMLRIVGVVALTGAALLGAAILIFLLDGVQVRQLSPIERRSLVTRGMMVATAKLLATSVVLILLSRGSWRASPSSLLARVTRAPIVGASS
jgi:hypothetical protein